MTGEFEMHFFLISHGCVFRFASNLFFNGLRKQQAIGRVRMQIELYLIEKDVQSIGPALFLTNKKRFYFPLPKEFVFSQTPKQLELSQVAM